MCNLILLLFLARALNGNSCHRLGPIIWIKNSIKSVHTLNSPMLTQTPHPLPTHTWVSVEKNNICQQQWSADEFGHSASTSEVQEVIIRVSSSDLAQLVLTEHHPQRCFFLLPPRLTKYTPSKPTLFLSPSVFYAASSPCRNRMNRLTLWEFLLPAC